jgi:FkbM family methyltransferase
MVMALKAKVKKFLISVSGRYSYLRRGVFIHKTWYGNKYGGFFVFQDLLNESSVVYSFGIGEDISFDESVINRHQCRVFGFDPTPKSIEWIKKHKQLSPRFIFFDYGIGDKSGPVEFRLPKNPDHVSGSFVSQNNVSESNLIQVEMKSLNDIISELGHTQIDVLKMDIEGAEYQVLDSILNASIPINQLVVEFHDRFFEDGKLQTINAIKKLRDRGYEIFGISDSFQEVSFIKKNLLPGVQKNAKNTQ